MKMLILVPHFGGAWVVAVGVIARLLLLLQPPQQRQHEVPALTLIIQKKQRRRLFQSVRQIWKILRLLLGHLHLPHAQLLVLLLRALLPLVQSRVSLMQTG